MSKKNTDSREPQNIICLGLGKNEQGQYGLFTATVDVANLKLGEVHFTPEAGLSEAVERFKISAGNLFMEV